MVRATKDTKPPRSRGMSLPRLLLLVMGVLVLVLPATMALATSSSADDAGANDRAANAASDDGKDHCDDEESGPGHKDCKPETNPKPENPPCDADHGHPEDNAKKCQDDEGDPCDDAGGDTDGDGVCDDDDDCPDEAGPAENNGCPDEGDPCDDAGGDTDGDGVCDDDDDCPDQEGPAENNGCPEDGTAENLCTAEAGDPGLPLTENTIGQEVWDGGGDALSPLTEDPERDGALSGPIGEGGTDTPLEPVTDEAACAVDLLIDGEELGGDL